MALEHIDHADLQPWTRKHDNPSRPRLEKAPRIFYPKSLEEVIEICKTREAFDRIKAAGSHWALSEAAVSDNVFVDTHDPNNDDPDKVHHQAMGKTLYEVVPDCLSTAFIDALANIPVPPFDKFNVGENQGLYPIHIETGKRVYQLYSELDLGDTDIRSLAIKLQNEKNNKTYLGPWAFQTLGGAGGQTVFAALTTGTHGGDFRMPPIADAVMALHLVADGGKHYWIEPESLAGSLGARLTDDQKLRNFYGKPQFGGPGNFEIIRDDNIFNSVLVSVGRFGIVYSIVLAAVRQYSLHQERRLTTWQEIKTQIRQRTHLDWSPLFTVPSVPNRFLQVAISVTPHHNFTKNRAGVTKRWNVKLAAKPQTDIPADIPAGREERCGKKGEFDPLIQGPRFEFAGNSFSYSPDPDNPGMAEPPGFLDRVCSDSNFIDGVIQEVINEVKEFVESNGAVAGATMVAVTAAGGGAVVVSALAALTVVLAALVAFLAALRASGKSRFGEVMNDVREVLLDRPTPQERLAGALIWQMISLKAFESQQEEHDFEAISYAVMDGHNYFNRSCEVNVDSIEVFFDATDPMLIAFIDSLLVFEITQTVELGRAFAGYISLRFTGRTRASIGPQRFGSEKPVPPPTENTPMVAPFPMSCAVEIAGLRDVEGSTELINYAISQALSSNYNAILHWGQRNESQRVHIEERFGEDLRKWRRALSRITQNGKLDRFSSDFTRRTGLEIVTPVTPIIESLTASGGRASDPITVQWDCDQNPPATEIRLQVTDPTGGSSLFRGLPLKGDREVTRAAIPGTSTMTLFAAIDFEGERNEVSKQINVNVLIP